MGRIYFTVRAEIFSPPKGPLTEHFSLQAREGEQQD
jgi:hypothetical protein